MRSTWISLIKSNQRFFIASCLLQTWAVVVSHRNIALVAQKAKDDTSFWPRLNKNGKLAWVKTDFSKWKDEDDDEEDGNQGQGPELNDEMMRMMGAQSLNMDMMNAANNGGANQFNFEV